MVNMEKLALIAFALAAFVLIGTLTARSSQLAATNSTSTSPINVTQPVNATKPRLNMTLGVSLVYLSYENWVNYPSNGLISTPLNYFTLLINASIVNSTILFNGSATLNIQIGNVYAYSVSFNLTTASYRLINVPVYSIPYGNYSINVTLSVLNFTISRIYRLIMYKPKIIGAYITQCGLTTPIVNNSIINMPYVSPKLNIIVYSAEPVKLSLVNTIGTYSSVSEITINGLQVVEEQLAFINGTVSAELTLNGQVYSSYLTQLSSSRPWFTVNVTYGELDVSVGNGSIIPVVTGHMVNVVGVYMSNLTMNVMVNGQSSSGSFLTVSSGAYDVKAYFNYGYCTVGSVEFTVRAYQPTAVVSTPNSTIPIGVESRVLINVTVPAPIISERIYVTPLLPQFPVSIIGGSAYLHGNGTFSVSMLALQPGPIPLNVTLIMTDDGGFLYSFNSIILLNVLKPELTTKPQFLNITYGKTVNLTIILTAGGLSLPRQIVQYQVTLNGVVIWSGAVTTNNSGEASISFKPNVTGVYMIYTTYSPSQSFLTSSQVKVIVEPATVTIGYLVNSTIVYGQLLTVAVNLSPRISGSVYVYINSSLAGYINVINGSGHIYIKPEEAGYLNLTLYYPGSQNYLPSIAKSSVIVLKAPCSIRVGVYGTFIVGDEVFIVGNTTAPVNTLPVSINNTSMTVDVVNGYFKATYTPRYPGLYIISINWPGNSNYLSCGFSGVIKVSKANPTVIVRVLNNGSISLGGSVILLVIVKAKHPFPTTSNALVFVNESGKLRIFSMQLVNGSMLRIGADRVGQWFIYLNYTGNEWLNQVIVGPVEVSVIPGLMGVPWYVFTIYALAIIMGLMISLLMRSS